MKEIETTKIYKKAVQSPEVSWSLSREEAE